MLNEEEKKAIKVLEQYKKECIEEYKIEIDNVEENIDQQHASYLHQQIEATYRVLNLITKLQKENEDLKREKEENKYIIAMANNEMLGYNQGYSDAKNQNSNATEIIMKNRQDYIHKEEVKLLQKKIEKYKYLYQKSLDNTVKLDKENIDLKKQVDLMNEYLERISQDLNNISIDQIPIAIAELKYKNKLADNQIDLMAEYIEKITVDMKIAFGENMLWDRNQIKQDFEKIAKEKGENNE